MQICKIHSNTVISLFDIFEKARDDTFKPITGISNRYKMWVAYIDLKTCPLCENIMVSGYKLFRRQTESPQNILVK